MAEITREHMELAALAAGIELECRRTSGAYYYDDPETGREEWRPHLDDGDAARLQVRLKMWTNAGIASLCDGEQVIERVVEHNGTEPDKLRAWREAVVLCAAAVGERMRNGSA